MASPLGVYDLRMLRPYRGVTPKVHETAYVDGSVQVIGDAVASILGYAERYVGYRLDYMNANS